MLLAPGRRQMAPFVLPSLPVLGVLGSEITGGSHVVDGHTTCVCVCVCVGLLRLADNFYNCYLYESSVGAGGRMYALVYLSVNSATTKRCV